MTKKIDVIELKDKIAEDFKALKDMASDLNNYFNNFYEENCNVPESKKEEKNTSSITEEFLKSNGFF